MITLIMADGTDENRGNDESWNRKSSKILETVLQSAILEQGRRIGSSDGHNY